MRVLLVSGVLMQSFKVRILLVVDNLPIREELSRSLASHEDILIVGEAIEGQQALELIAAHRPDVVLLDINMRSMSAIEAASMIKKSWLGTTIIGFCVIQDPYVTAAFLRAGAVAVLAKDSLDLLHPTIQRACRNKLAA